MLMWGMQDGATGTFASENILFYGVDSDSVTYFEQNATGNRSGALWADGLGYSGDATSFCGFSEVAPPAPVMRLDP